MQMKIVPPICAMRLRLSRSHASPPSDLDATELAAFSRCCLIITSPWIHPHLDDVDE